MKKYQAVLFDLDGTLIDTALGIRNCYAHALETIGRQPPSPEWLDGAIGSPLPQVFHRRLGLDGEILSRAIKSYRDRYAEAGWREAADYQGVPELLKKLHEQGFRMGVATLKADRFAQSMLKYRGWATYFGSIRGVDDQDSFTKSHLIRACLEELGIKPEAAVYVGDSKHDAEGARLVGVDFVAVLYGYGFSDQSHLHHWPRVCQIEKPADLLSFLGTA